MFIWTGNVVSDLPDPEPDWLAQQVANTNEIAALNRNTHITAWYNGQGNKQWKSHVLFNNVEGGTLKAGQVVIPQSGVYLLNYGFYDSEGKSGTANTRMGFSVNTQYGVLPLVGSAAFGGSMCVTRRLNKGDLISVAPQGTVYYFWAHSSRDHNHLSVTRISD